MYVESMVYSTIDSKFDTMSAKVILLQFYKIHAYYITSNYYQAKEAEESNTPSTPTMSAIDQRVKTLLVSHCPPVTKSTSL
jgi:hypothetical protein